jgi:ABC-type uncharacterized transport system substrate-binding protein
MNRREFLTYAAVWPGVAWTSGLLAQPKSGPVLIGLLNFGNRDSNAAAPAAFKDALVALGWKESPQFIIEERWANGRIERLPLLAAELAAMKPAVIVGGSSQVIAAAAKAAPHTPIVQAGGTDPVVTGFAKSLARPGGMITGLSNVAGNTTEKQLELLVAAAPKVRRVAFLTDSTNLARAQLADAVRRSLAPHSVEARFADIGTSEEIEPALKRLANEGAQALVVVASPMFNTERRRIIKLALANRWPVVAYSRIWAEDGALLSYGADSTANFRRAAYYVDRILKGAKPGELPIEQPTKIELLINRKTANALGLPIPQAVLLQADQVIE